MIVDILEKALYAWLTGAMLMLVIMQAWWYSLADDLPTGKRVVECLRALPMQIVLSLLTSWFGIIGIARCLIALYRAFSKEESGNTMSSVAMEEM